MTLNRYAVQRDDNEDEIVSALRRCGYRVWRHDQPLDLLVYFQRIRTRGAAFGFLEVKTERGKLTAAQDQFFGDTDGAPRAVVRDALEALAAQWLSRHAKVGVKSLGESLRWTSGLQVEGDPYRINNSYLSRYARLLIERHPEWADAIETRSLAAERAA